MFLSTGFIDFKYLLIYVVPKTTEKLSSATTPEPTLVCVPIIFNFVLDAL